MVVTHVGVWIYVSLVFSILSPIAMAQDLSDTVAPSSEFTISLSAQTSFIATGMSTPTLEPRRDSALITSSPVRSISASVSHVTSSSSGQPIQQTYTLSDISKVKVTSISETSRAVSTEQLVVTSSMSFGDVVNSLSTVSELATTTSAIIASSTQVTSSASASPASVSRVPSISVMVGASSSTSKDLSSTQVTTLPDRYSTSLLTSPLPSSTRVVSETVSSHQSFTAGSLHPSSVRSETVSSSLSLSSAMPVLESSFYTSSSVPQTSSVLVSVDSSSPSSPGRTTVVKTISESVIPTQATSVSSSVPFSSSSLDTMDVSLTTTAPFQSSASRMTSDISSLLPSTSSHGAFDFQTTVTNLETLLTPSDHVITVHTKSEVFSTPILTSLESSKSEVMFAHSEQAASSSDITMTYATSLQQTAMSTVSSAQSGIVSSTAIHEIQVAPSSTIQRPSTSLLPEQFSTLEPSASSSHVELTTSVVASPKSSTVDHSTTPSIEHSVTPWLPTLIAKNISFEIEFKGVCNPLVQRKIVLEIFWEELVITIAKTLHIDNTDIKPKDIACRPIRISFVIMETTRPNVTQILKTLVASGAFKFKIPVLVGGTESKYQYEAVSVKQVPLSYDISGTPDLYEIGLNKVDIIVIIVACCVSFILICIGCCICLREYYIRKRSRSFDLSDIVNFNLKLEDYTLTKIPRNKPFYSDNAVKMQSFTRTNGQQTKSLLEQEENCNCDDVNVMKEVKVRMNSHSDGIVIGVTATSIPDVVTNHHASHDDQTDQSKEILFENESSPTHCMDNPIYFADDDRFTAV